MKSLMQTQPYEIEQSTNLIGRKFPAKMLMKIHFCSRRICNLLAVYQIIFAGHLDLQSFA